MNLRILVVTATALAASLGCSHSTEPAKPAASPQTMTCANCPACAGSAGGGPMMGGHMGGGPMMGQGHMMGGCGMGGGPMMGGGGPMMGGGPAAPMPGMACTFGSGPLSESAKAAIGRALADERNAEDRYAAALAHFGPVRPFSQTVRAERRHSFALVRLLEAHGATVPPREKSTATAPSTLQEACDASVSAEQKNVALYDELLKSDLPDDVRCVFQNLRSASNDRHLPAFQHCAK